MSVFGSKWQFLKLGFACHGLRPKRRARTALVGLDDGEDSSDGFPDIVAVGYEKGRVSLDFFVQAIIITSKSEENIPLRQYSDRYR